MILGIRNYFKMRKGTTALYEPFVKAIISGTFEFFITNYSHQGFRQSWQLEGSMLTDVKICLKYVHENHKACTWIQVEKSIGHMKEITMKVNISRKQGIRSKLLASSILTADKL